MQLTLSGEQRTHAHTLTFLHFTVKPRVTRGTDTGGVPTLAIVVAGESPMAYCYIYICVENRELMPSHAGVSD